MRILISNDDGYQAPGIICLEQMLKTFADVFVVAPDRNRSGASNSLTLENPIRATTVDNGYVKVDGTPTDCVHLAITGLLEQEPDMVVSGINAGANLGDDILYSGTVAAAMEGRFLGYPAIAVSLSGEKPGENLVHYDTAAHVVEKMVKHLQVDPLPADTILNINVPDIPYEQVKSIEVTRLGHRHKSEPVIKSVDPKGRTIYWIGPPGPEQEGGRGTDFNAVKNGSVSITPIQIDLTHHASLDQISHWIKGVGL